MQPMHVAWDAGLFVLRAREKKMYCACISVLASLCLLLCVCFSVLAHTNMHPYVRVLELQAACTPRP